MREAVKCSAESSALEDEFPGFAAEIAPVFQNRDAVDVNMLDPAGSEVRLALINTQGVGPQYRQVCLIPGL